MSKSERVDEIAPVFAAAGRVAGSLIKNFTKKKTMEKAKEKVGLSDLEKTRAREAHFKEKSAGQERSGSATRQAAQDSATRRSKLGEALHTAYKNLIMETMTGPDGTGLSPKEVADAKERVNSKKASGGAPSPSPTTKERPKPSRVRSALTGAALRGLTALDGAAESAKKGAGNMIGRAANAIQKFRADRADAKQIRGDNRAKKRAENQAAKETAQGQRGIEREKARVRAEKAAAKAQAKERQAAAKAQNRSQRGTQQTLGGRGLDRLKDRVVDFATAKGLRTGLSNTRRSVNRGRAAMKARRERIQFQHTEYQRIGSIIAEKSAAWTRKEGKNPSGGLNAKGVASYRAKNPGSKLKTAVTTKPSKLKKGSKAAKRRRSFCARMSGMRKRQKSSNNTGKDRLSLSLKKWNC